MKPRFFESLILSLILGVAGLAVHSLEKISNEIARLSEITTIIVTKLEYFDRRITDLEAKR